MRTSLLGSRLAALEQQGVTTRWWKQEQQHRAAQQGKQKQHHRAAQQGKQEQQHRAAQRIAAHLRLAAAAGGGHCTDVRGRQVKHRLQPAARQGEKQRHAAVCRVSQHPPGQVATLHAKRALSVGQASLPDTLPPSRESRVQGGHADGQGQPRDDIVTLPQSRVLVGAKGAQPGGWGGGGGGHDPAAVGWGSAEGELRALPIAELVRDVQQAAAEAGGNGGLQFRGRAAVRQWHRVGVECCAAVGEAVAAWRPRPTQRKVQTVTTLTRRTASWLTSMRRNSCRAAAGTSRGRRYSPRPANSWPMTALVGSTSTRPRDAARSSSARQGCQNGAEHERQGRHRVPALRPCHPPAQHPSQAWQHQNAPQHSLSSLKRRTPHKRSAQRTACPERISASKAAVEPAGRSGHRSGGLGGGGRRAGRGTGRGGGRRGCLGSAAAAAAETEPLIVGGASLPGWADDACCSRRCVLPGWCSIESPCPRLSIAAGYQSVNRKRNDTDCKNS